MIAIIFCFEIISLLNSKKNRITFYFKIIHAMNIIKRGFLIGLFVEAFKVGS